MVTIYKTDKVERTENGYTIAVELRGLSTDEKPTTIENSKVQNGSAFIEIDTQDIYFYDGEEEQWKGV